VRVVWAARAQRRLRQIVADISADQPPAAERVLDRMLAAARTLGEHPNLGRQGRLRGTRELVVAGTAYLLIYRVQGDTLQILTVFDGRRRGPPER
jgi:addiction module RelE/StbE family toxin